MREKLIELLETIPHPQRLYPDLFVDSLIANGVTIKSDCEDCASKATRNIDKLHGEIAKLRKAQEWIPNIEKHQPRPMTNADRIRAMTNEELAEFLQDAKFYCQRNCEKCLRGTACISMLQWLKQPAEGE